MQKECAVSFIKPLQLNLFSKQNKEKMVKAAIQITTDEGNADNQNLIDVWIEVLELAVTGLEIPFISKFVILIIKEMIGM